MKNTMVAVINSIHNLNVIFIFGVLIYIYLKEQRKINKMWKVIPDREKVHPITTGQEMDSWVKYRRE